MTYISSSAIRAPLANYSHGVLVEAGSRLLFCSGQLGVAPDEDIPLAAYDQACLCFDNVAALLAEATMAVADVVRINAYVTAREYWGEYMRARDEFLDGATPAPASTLMIVVGFAKPELKVEVEVIAADS